MKRKIHTYVTRIKPGSLCKRYQADIMEEVEEMILGKKSKRNK